MNNWKVEINKLTDENLLHIANEFTSGKESKQTLKSAYRCGHSTIRTQIFLVRLYGIPQYVAYHFRTHFSLFPMAPEEYGWMLSKRVDKGGGDFRKVCVELSSKIYDIINFCDGRGMGDEPYEDSLSEDDNLGFIADEIEALPDKYERYAPTNFCFLVSAEGLMNMAAKRLCAGSVSKETREVMESICEAVNYVDPDLYPYLVRPCVATGICREKCCGFIRSDLFKKLRTQYKILFVQ